MATKMKMRAVFDCSADDAGELSFKEGDILVDVVNSSEEGWYSGRLENTSTIGLFPYNYVERIYESKESTPEQVTDTPEPISPNINILTSTRTTANKPTPSRLDNNTTVLLGFPALDAFEAAMSGKSLKATTNTSSPPPVISPKPKLTTGSVNSNQGLGIKPIAPVIAEKPQLKNLNLNGDISPTRIRSYSTSSVLNKEDSDKTLRPSQLLHGKGTKSALELALSKGSPATNTRIQSKLRSNSFSKQNINPGGIPLVGMANLKLTSSVSNDVEEEDGFQMIKPSQLRQRQQQSSPNPVVSKSSAPVSSFTNKSWKNSNESVIKVNVLNNSPKKSTSSKLEDVPISTSPMPRLPSRPGSNASRRSRNSRGNSLNSSPSTSADATPVTSKVALPPVKENAQDKAGPPILKPKPVIAQPNLPRRPSNKTRSSSNPPPLQPKPAAMSSIEVLLSKNNNTEKKKSSESSTQPPPRVSSNKPAYQPKSQYSKSSSNGTTNNFDNWRSTDTEVNIKPSSLLNRARSSTNPTSNTDWSNAMTKRTNNTGLDTKPEVKKKATPPPPPPSRPPKNSNANNNKSNNNIVMDEASKHRYEILFDTIHDDGYVDGETARFIWLKSKLSSEELSRIWKECDPDHRGLLDRNAFIDGMGRIDELLMHKQQQQVVL